MKKIAAQARQTVLKAEVRAHSMVVRVLDGRDAEATSRTVAGLGEHLQTAETVARTAAHVVRVAARLYGF